LKLKVGLKTVDIHAIADVNALLDCGVTNLFINHAFVQKKEIRMHKLQDPITVYNIDGTVNRGGSVMEEVTLIESHQGHKERAIFEVCDLGKNDLIIEFMWLKKHNPEIDWRTGEVQMTHCPRECNVFARQLKKEKKVKREEQYTEVFCYDGGGS
jgi:Retroviral aspartyl protease